MFDLKILSRAIQQLAEEKNIAQEKIVEAVESALAAAYKKEYEKRSEMIRAKFDIKTGDTQFFLVKTVVDETTVDMTPPPVGEEFEPKIVGPTTEIKAEGLEEKLPRYNPDRHITIEEAKTSKPDVQLGEEILFPLEARQDFG